MSTPLDAIATAAQQKLNIANTARLLRNQHAEFAKTAKTVSDGKAALAAQLAQPSTAALFTPDEHAVLTEVVAALPSVAPSAPAAPTA